VAADPRGFLACECKAAQFCRTKPCKHVEQVRRGCGLVAQPKRQPLEERTVTVSAETRDVLAALEV
jgi:hypothetical protein